MPDLPDFDLRDFTPYLLNMAAETASADFERYYKAHFGMLRTEWRVVFHLGRFGPLTAKDICDRGRLHKTKVSRAVVALEKKRFLGRTQSDTDRRRERLHLTKAGLAAFNKLNEQAQAFDETLTMRLTLEERTILKRALREIADL